MQNAGSVVTDKLGSISNFTLETIYELRDTIWAMNKSDISVEDLQGRISNFIEKAKSSSDVNFQFNVGENLMMKKQFTSVQGMNIYRIIQEAVNNALKHSHASKISVSLTTQALLPFEKTQTNSFKLEIIDNGNGFDSEKSGLGNGLLNIKKRAKDLDAKLEISSEINKGTIVKLIF